MKSQDNLWTDNLYVKDILTGKRMDPHNSNKEDDDDRMRIVCWNVLAESFLTPTSHPGLSPESQRIVFHPKKRWTLIGNEITKFITIHKFDILCFQEVDMYDELQSQIFQPLNYQSIHATRQQPQKQQYSKKQTKNGCMIAFDTCKYKLLKSKIIYFDNLTQSNDNNDKSNKYNSNNNKNNNNNNNNNKRSLCGMIASYNRRNTGLLVLLQHQTSGSIVCIANAHLYWNPGYEYVKLSQCKYFIHCAQIFAQTTTTDNNHNQQRYPIIICGDFNSKPTSIVYQFITQRTVDARLVAPWYHHYFTQQQQQQQESSSILPFTNNEEEKKNNNNDHDINTTTLRMETLHLNHDTNTTADELSIFPSNNNHNHHHTIEMRYLLDFTLNRFTRWLRILGIDAALETKEEEYQRTRHGNM